MRLSLLPIRLWVWGHGDGLNPLGFSVDQWSTPTSSHLPCLGISFARLSGFLAIQLFVSMDLQHFNMFEWLNFVNLVSHPKHELTHAPRY